MKYRKETKRINENIFLLIEENFFSVCIDAKIHYIDINVDQIAVIELIGNIAATVQFIQSTGV